MIMILKQRNMSTMYTKDKCGSTNYSCPCIYHFLNILNSFYLFFFLLLIFSDLLMCPFQCHYLKLKLRNRVVRFRPINRYSSRAVPSVPVRLRASPGGNPVPAYRRLKKRYINFTTLTTKLRKKQKKINKKIKNYLYVSYVTHMVEQIPYFRRIQQLPRKSY